MSLSIFPKKKFELEAALDRKNVTTENIFNLLESYVDLKERNLKITDMYNMSYKDRFALYTIKQNWKNRDIYNLIWYSYWAKYNRTNENDVMSPKYMYLDINNKILEAKFYWDNVIVQFVEQKDLWRDSYYISYSNSEYLISWDHESVIAEALNNKNIYLGSSYLKFKLDDLWFYDKIKLASIWNAFSKITWFHMHYAYRTFQEISLHDIQNKTDQLFKLQQNLIKESINIDDIEQITNIWEKWGNVLPVKPE